MLAALLSLLAYNMYNSAEEYGGGIQAQCHCTLSLSGGIHFINNSAKYGGGVNLYEGSTVDINGDSSFINNAAFFGGGVCGKLASTQVTTSLTR